MATENDIATTKPRTVGMDLLHPYNVYLDGKLVATYDSEKDASEHYNLLAGRSFKPSGTSLDSRT